MTNPTMVPDPYLIERESEQFDLAHQAFALARHERNAGIRRAYAHGVTVSQLVKITGLSRARIYQMLDLSADYRNGKE